MNISKELLSEVLAEEVGSFEIKNNKLIYMIKVCFGYKTINIHELAHKCKEWARDKYDCTISSSIYKEYSKCWAISFDESFVAPTEPEAIFQACQWILDQKDNT
jgi:hypothetical protein